MFVETTSLFTLVVAEMCSPERPGYAVACVDLLARLVLLEVRRRDALWSLLVLGHVLGIAYA